MPFTMNSLHPGLSALQESPSCPSILCSPVDDALLEVAGAIEHGVFSDPDCPVCDALPSVKLLRQQGSGH